MRIELGLHVVMSGGGGFDLTDVLDFNAFLIDGGNGEWVLFDAGAGRSPNDANAILAADGIDPAAIRHLFLTHCHADHSGGARGLRDQLGLAVYAGRVTTPMVVAGDEAAISLEPARRAGVYPHDYRYRACPVDHVLGDDAATTIGRLKIRTIETPGHSADHVSFLVERGGRRPLIAGDALFHGGRTPCRTSRTAASPTSAQRCESLPPLSSMHSCPAT